MADGDRNQEQGRPPEHSPEREEERRDPDQPPRGTSSPAVGGSKQHADTTDTDAMDPRDLGEPPDNAGGETINNPDVGPGA